jgi:CBS domain-containing protein
MDHLATLNAFIRTGSFLSPGDSVHRAVEMLRDSPHDSLPVLDSYGRLLGALSVSDLAPMLTESNWLNGPVAQWMHEPSAVGHADLSPDEARRALAESGESTLFLLDDSGRYVGAITVADLLVPIHTPPRPPSIGGMATPWGVYLTNGSIQAGVGNWALLGSGALLGVLMALSYVAIGLACWGAQRAFGVPAYNLWTANPPAQISTANYGYFILQGISLPLFLLMMRALPLAGYHAAEHQVVHAMERSEPLCPEVVSRMPRVHPRCGTNLMAAVLIFGMVSKAFSGIGLDMTDSAMLAALTALFTWRSVGAVLQHYFTTRPANLRQLEAGIAAANDLDHKYLTTVLRRPPLVRRIWCMGMPQMVLGSSVVATALLYLFDMLFHHL